MDYDIYREELAIKHPAYGHALWEPSPGGRYTSVEIGDVGFIRQGYFHRLFNILLPEDHQSHEDGVPQGHEPLLLRVTSPTNTGKLQPNNLRSTGVSDRSDEHRLGATGPDEAAQQSFSCTKRRGAILSLPLAAQGTDTAARGDFARCMIRNIDVWFAFAQQRGLGINREDIILVTGCHLARSWATIAFQERGEQIAFGVRTSGTSDVTWQFTPEGAQGVPYNLGPSGQNLPENQCIFIKGFRASQFSLILPRLRGAAGPAPDLEPDDEDDCDKNDNQLPGIPTDTSYQDPLCTLLEYISSEAPNCEMGLIHDDDLRSVCSPSLESLRPDALMSHLQHQAPVIWQYTCDIPPTGKLEAKAPSVTVATLSKFDLADEFKPVASSELTSEADLEAKPPSIKPATLSKPPSIRRATLPKTEAKSPSMSPATLLKSLPKTEVKSPPTTPATLPKSLPKTEARTPSITSATLPTSETKSPSVAPTTLPNLNIADESKTAISSDATSHSDKAEPEAKPLSITPAPLPTSEAKAQPLSPATSSESDTADESEPAVPREVTSHSDKGKPAEAKAPSLPPATLPESDTADKSEPAVPKEVTSQSDKGKPAEAKAPSVTAVAALLSNLDTTDESKQAVSKVPSLTVATLSNLDKTDESKSVVSSEMIRRESTTLAKEKTEAPQTA